jgi:hypothetical protein
MGADEAGDVALVACAKQAAERVRFAPLCTNRTIDPAYKIDKTTTMQTQSKRKTFVVALLRSKEPHQLRILHRDHLLEMSLRALLLSTQFFATCNDDLVASVAGGCHCRRCAWRRRIECTQMRICRI